MKDKFYDVYYLGQFGEKTLGARTTSKSIAWILVQALKLRGFNGVKIS